MTDDFVHPEVARDRYQRLTALQDRLSLEANQAVVGTRVEVLIDGPSKKDPALASGRTRTNKLVHFPTSSSAGTFAAARVVRATPHYLVGEPV